MRRVRLGDVAQFNPRPQRGLGGSDPVSFMPLSAVSVDGTTAAGIDSLRSDVSKGHPWFVCGDILVAKITPSFENGKIARASITFPEGYSSTEFHVVRPDQKVLDPDYLLAFLRSEGVRRYGAGKMKGSAGQRRLPADVLKSLFVPVPTLVLQRSVASRLRSIAALIALSRRQLSLLDELVKSRFVEMFGDPDLKDRGFETAFGTDLFKIGNGKSRPASKRFNEGVPAYGGNGVSWYTDETLVDFDTIVIGRVGRHCGNTRLVEAPFWVTDNAMYIKEFKRDCFDKVFLINLMNIIGFNRFADEGDLWKISQKPFVEYEYPIPPLSLQCEFAAFAAEVAKSQFVGRAVRDVLYCYVRETSSTAEREDVSASPQTD